MPFKFSNTPIAGLLIVEPAVFKDERGFFLESYKESDFKSNGIDVVFKQDNHSVSKKNVLRGLHFQLSPAGQGKLVRVIKGSVWDVAVDIRRSSNTFLKWHAVELSADNGAMLWIPEGFAHGFVSLSDDTHLVYKCTEEYNPRLDSGIKWDDSEINIRWPINNPLVSDKDAQLPYLSDAVVYP